VNLGRDGSKCISFLQKPQLLALLVDGLIISTQPLTAVSQKMIMKLLSVATVSSTSVSATESTIYNDDNNNLGYLTDLLLKINSINQSLMSMINLFNETIKMSFGVISYEKLTLFGELMSIPIVSLCTLRWVVLTSRNTYYSSKSAYLTVLPVFFQVVTIAAGRHSVLLPDCFEAIKVSMLI
jgi:hypothetical protein